MSQCFRFSCGQPTQLVRDGQVFYTQTTPSLPSVVNSSGMQQAKPQTIQYTDDLSELYDGRYTWLLTEEQMAVIDQFIAEFDESERLVHSYDDRGAYLGYVPYQHALRVIDTPPPGTDWIVIDGQWQPGLTELQAMKQDAVDLWAEQEKCSGVSYQHWLFSSDATSRARIQSLLLSGSNPLGYWVDSAGVEQVMSFDDMQKLQAALIVKDASIDKRQRDLKAQIPTMVYADLFHFTPEWQKE